MPVEVVMPKFGLTMQEGTIQRWFKTIGDPLQQGEPLFEVETEKVLYEVEAPVSGCLATQLYPVETSVACGKPVAVIAVGDEDPTVVAARYERPPVVHADVSPDRVAGVPPPGGTPQPASTASGRRAPVTPAARKLAREHDIDLSAVTGSGPGGRVTREDVEAFIAGNTGSRSATAVSLHGIRRSIADHMLHSLQTTAQLTITTEADVTALRLRRERLQPEYALTYTDLLVEAVAKALGEHPCLNATADADGVHRHHDVHVGVAVALDEGLVVPVIRDAGRKTLREIAQESRRLAERARAGTLGVDDVTGGTFSITNLGMYGIDAFTPILHTPQVAILGVGRLVEKPAVHAGRIMPRAMMVLSLTFDHRVVDGAPAAAFLRSVVTHLQGDEPAS